jgi:hypothetical protein
VPRRFDIYVSVLRGEMPSFESFSVGQRYVAVAPKLTDSRERAVLSLADSDAPVYGPVQCTGFLSPTRRARWVSGDKIAIGEAIGRIAGNLYA